MSSRRGWLCSFAGIVLFLCVIPDVRGGVLSIQNCPTNVPTTRSDLAYWTSPTVTTDQPHGFTLTRSHLPGRYYYKNTTVTYTATDGNETMTCVFDIIVLDNGSPVIISCPGDTPLATPPFGQTQASVTWMSPVLGSTGVQISSTKNSGDLFDLGRTIVKYTFKNNVASSFCTFDVFVNEPAATTVATITCPAIIDVTLPLGVESMAVTWDDPVYPTNLGSVTLNCGRTKGDFFFVGTNTITCVAYFESNEAKMCSFDVVVTKTQDSQDPSILNCPANINKYVAPAMTGAIVAWTEPTITDNSMTNLNLVGTHTNGDFYNIGPYDVIYTGTDAAGNSVECSFRITVQVDNLPPTFVNCPAAPVVKYIKANQASGVVTWDEPTATDNSGPVTPVRTPGILIVANGASLTAGAAPATVSYTAMDGFGNENNCVFTVSVVVDERPTYIGCDTSNVTVDAVQGTNSANVTWTEPSATDVLSPNSLTLTKSHEPGQSLDIGVYIVQYTATDEVGNVAVCTFTVIVRDGQKPVLGQCPASRTISLTQSQQSVQVTWTNPTATDNSGVAPTVTSSRSPGPYIAGDYRVTVTATDGSMNVAMCSFTIRVTSYVPDTSKPTWSNCPSSASSNTDSGVATAAYSWTAPIPSDDRGIVATFVSHTSPFNFPIGDTIVRYQATDAGGNAGECTFTVVVTDNQVPVWAANTGCGTTISYYVLATRPTSLEIVITNPVATDNSGIAPTITKQQTNSVTPTLFPVGNTDITYTATDAAGLMNSNCVIKVQVIAASTTWSPRGSITFTHIRGQLSGQITSLGSAQLLNELASDMDKLFRRTSVGTQFAGVGDFSYNIVGGNTVVTFQLHFTRNGRYTSRVLKEAFNTAIAGTNQFATSNLVVANSFNLNVREFKLTTTLIRLDAVTNPPFLNNYNNRTSNEFTELANRLNTQLDSAFLGSFSYLISVVVYMRPGSIVQDTILVFDGSSLSTETQIVDLFNGKLSTPGELGTASGLYFDRVANTLNQELCPSTECSNSGTCSVSSTYSNVCTCLAGFTGTTCQTTVTTTELSPLAIAAIIGGGVLLLILLFALFCCCMYFMRTPFKPVEQYPMERPFHFLDDEASVASSMDIFMLPRKRERSYLPILPPPSPPTLHIETDQYPSDGPSFSPDGEVYVTGPNQVAIRPSSKRHGFY